MRSTDLAVLACLACFASLASAEDFRYPEATSGAGELRYVGGVPVAVLKGTPEEIGTQFGHLVLKPSIALVRAMPKYLASAKLTAAPIKMAFNGKKLIESFPASYLAEIDAAAKVSGVSRNDLIFVNTLADVSKVGGCSTLIAEGDRSATGRPIFGRNLDWPPYESLPSYTLIVVTHAKGRRACAMVTLPVVFGCISGINDAGLCLTLNEITATRDGSSGFDPEGVPMLPLYRETLEKCGSVAEAIAYLKAAKRTTYACVTLCDSKGGCVLEITPKSIEVRRGERSVVCCTNHFRTEPLSVTKTCERYSILEKIQKAEGKLGVADIFKGLDAVNQGEATMQSMVFEPTELRVHLAFGIEASKKKLEAVELKDVLTGGWGKKK